MRSSLRLLSLALIGALAAHGWSQTPWEQGTAFVNKAWQKVQSQGASAAESAVRQAPARFRDVKRQVQSVSKQVQRMAKSARLEEKKNLALQLWEIRGSLDLMALLNPDTLEALTGIDAPLLRKLRNETARLEALMLRLGK